MPKREAEGDTKGGNGGTTEKIHRWLATPAPPKPEPSPAKAPAEKGEKGERRKPMLARMGIIPQEMGTLNQAGHRKLKALESLTDECAFLTTLYFCWLYSLKYYFLSSFIKMQNFVLSFLFFFLSYVVSTQHTSLFWGEENTLLTESLQSWTNVGEKHLSLQFW